MHLMGPMFFVYIYMFLRYIIFGIIYKPNFRRAVKKLVIRPIKCSPPRKSLVKGERFMRVMKGNQGADAMSAGRI